MDLVINIYYKGQNGNARRFAEEMISSGIVDKIRKEKGNKRYEYFYPLENDDTVLLIDCWEDENALKQHHKSPLMKEIEILKEKYKIKMKAYKYSEIKGE